VVLQIVFLFFRHEVPTVCCSPSPQAQGCGDGSILD
jgi:hypothetical protein